MGSPTRHWGEMGCAGTKCSAHLDIITYSPNYYYLFQDEEGKKYRVLNFIADTWN